LGRCRGFFAGGQILISNRLKDLFVETGLVGFSSLEIVKISRRKTRSGSHLITCWPRSSAAACWLSRHRSIVRTVRHRSRSDSAIQATVCPATKRRIQLIYTGRPGYERGSSPCKCGRPMSSIRRGLSQPPRYLFVYRRDQPRSVSCKARSTVGVIQILPSPVRGDVSKPGIGSENG
jgi:hypothetical protein